MKSRVVKMVPVHFAVLLMLFSAGDLQETETETEELTVLQRIANEEAKSFVPFGEFRVFAASHKSTLPQMFLSDADAKEICEPYVKGLRSVTLAHSKTCAGHVTCLSFKKNSFLVDTVYRVQLFTNPNAENTFWSNDLNSQVYNTDREKHKCPVDPCITGKSITDGRTCYTYIRCNRNATTNSVIGYVTEFCPDGFFFDPRSSQCEANENAPSDEWVCVRNKNSRVTLYCNATDPPEVRDPNISDQAFYNLTYIDMDFFNATFTELKYCAYGVFNTDKPELCECDITRPNISTCVYEYENVSSSRSEWPAKISAQGGQLSVPTSGSYAGWAEFKGGAYDFYQMESFENTELTGTFMISFSFVLKERPNQNIALVSNAYLENTLCPSPTIEIYVDCCSVYAVAKNAGGTEVSVKITYPMNAQVRYELLLERLASGNIKLTLPNLAVTGTSTSSLGGVRLMSTKCGLYWGQGEGRQAFNGYLDNVIVKKTCASDK